MPALASSPCPLASAPASVDCANKVNHAIRCHLAERLVALILYIVEPRGQLDLYIYVGTAEAIRRRHENVLVLVANTILHNLNNLSTKF